MQMTDTVFISRGIAVPLLQTIDPLILCNDRFCLLHINSSLSTQSLGQRGVILSSHDRDIGANGWRWLNFHSQVMQSFSLPFSCLIRAARASAASAFCGSFFFTGTFRGTRRIWWKRCDPAECHPSPRIRCSTRLRVRTLKL